MRARFIGGTLDGTTREDVDGHRFIYASGPRFEKRETYVRTRERERDANGEVVCVTMRLEGENEKPLDDYVEPLLAQARKRDRRPLEARVHPALFKRFADELGAKVVISEETGDEWLQLFTFRGLLAIVSDPEGTPL